MTQTVFEKMKTAISVLKLDFTTEEFATFADDQELSEEAIEAVQTVFSYISEKKQQTTVQTLLKLSRLPKKAPKTFENFDFSLLKSRDLDRIRALPSLGAVYSHRNLAFIGPPGTGKTHLAQAFGYACCQHGMRAYFIKASELRDRFTAARRVGKTDSCLKSLVRPSCLIIDEIGHCEFDKENTRGQTQDCMQITGSKQLLADDLASAALKEHVVRHDHRSLARGFQDGIDVLDEIELLVAAGGPEILTVIYEVFFLLFAFLIGEGEGGFFAEGRVC